MTGRRLPRPFTPAELTALERAARPEVAATMCFLRETGLRSAEACSLSSEDARSWARPPWWCRRAGCARHSVSVRIIGKGDKERAVLLTPVALRASRVMAAHASNGHLIGWSDRGLRYVLAEAGKTAGVHCHPHRYRHTWITELVESGAPIEVVADMAGHASIDTTRIYYASSTTRQLSAQHRRGRYLRRSSHA